jgi:hypothetical protein
MPSSIHDTAVEAEQLPLFQLAAPAPPRSTALPCVGTPRAPRGNRRSDTGQLQPMRYSEPCVGDSIRFADPKGGSRRRPRCAVVES